MSSEVQILVFELDQQRYGLHLSAVERVLRAVEVTPLPQTPNVVWGVIDIEGQIVPIPDLNHRDVTILGTDINPAFLRKAVRGVYSEWSFRDTPRWLKQQYFKRYRDDQYQILPETREMITFSYLNLAEDNFPSFLSNTHAMDFILCRSVLMYFAPELTKRTINKFYGALVERGWHRRSLLSQAFENNISRP